MSSIQKIGILGGTFDPVHLGHLIIAESVINEFKLNKIYFIPAHKHALKLNAKISPPELRLKMLQLAIRDFEYFEISQIEFKNVDTSYTVDTLSNFNKYENIKESEIYYIIGHDIISEFHLWKDYKKIINLSKIVIVGRQSNQKMARSNEFKNEFIFANTPNIEISSTLIRNRIKDKQNWKSLVPPNVAQFIIKNQLYS